MKHLKYILYPMLIISLLLTTACNSGKADKSTTDRTGRYVETDITPPIDGWLMSFIAGDGSIVCFSAGLQTRYDSSDGGESWSESPGPARNSGDKTERYINVRSGALLPDGRLLAYLQNEGLTLISPDGASEHYPVADVDAAVANGENVSVTLLQSLGSDRLLLEYMIGGMNMIGGRPIGQPGPNGGVQPGETLDSSVPGNSGPTTVSEPATVSGPDEGPGPEADPGAGPQRGNPQSGNRQNGNSTMSLDSMSRKSMLYELSSGKLITELPSDNTYAAAADDGTLYMMYAQGSINKFDLKDGSALRGNTVNLGGGGRGNNMFAMPGLGQSGGVLTAAGDGGLYALYDGNLLLCGTEGEIDTVLEGSAYSIGSPNSSAVTVFTLPDGTIIINMLENMQSNRLYKYVWDENAEINPDKTLSVWSLEENSFVRAAIAELRKKNPDSYISYEVAIDGDNAVSSADAIKTLNTRLLNGSGPDVIILDGCPAASYADRGILLELSALVDVGDVYENLLSSYITGGKMYCIPTQFIMPALLGSAEELEKARTLDDLVNLVVNGNDTAAIRPGAGMGPFSGIPEEDRAELYFENLSELCNIMWMSGAPAIIKDNVLDADALRQYLSAIKSISDKYALTDADAGNTFGIGVAFASGGRATALSGSLVRYTSRMTNLGAFSASNLMLLQLTMDRAGSDMAPFPGLVQGAWRPSTVAGISADTKVKDFAVEFLKAMLSVDVQQINYGAGLPVTRAGIAAQIQAMNDMLADTDREPFDIDMDALIGALTAPSVNDTTLTDMMWGSVEKLCKGENDVEGAVREIEQNVKNYLAERA